MADSGRQRPLDGDGAGAETFSLGGVPIRAAALRWKFTRASGPGGQHVNKVATAAECRLDLAQAALPAAIRERLAQLAGSRLNRRGELVLVADQERSQARNRAIALARLEELVAAAKPAPKTRIATAPSKAQRAKRREDKRRRGATKQQRQPPATPPGGVE